MGWSNILGAVIGTMSTAEVINVIIILVIFFIFWLILRAVKRKGLAVNNASRPNKKKSKK